MFAVNMEDVWNILLACKPYLIFMGIVVAAGIIIIIACGKLEKPKKKLIRSEALISVFLVLAIVVNLICWGPMSTLISLATGNGTITEETSAEAMELCRVVAEEGIVLLKNEEDFLPLNSSTPLNVFGWSSTNPCYGGTGSGSISDSYETVDILQGLEGGGFQLNNKLSNFYTQYRGDRPVIMAVGGNKSVDWTLPEPPLSTYGDDLIADAKEFSDTAVVVIARVGGEGVDIPTDVSTANYTDNSEDYKDFQPGEHYLQLNKTERDMLDMVCANFDQVIVVYNGANTMELSFLDEYQQIKSAIWCPGAGQTGFMALGEILNGSINPSGKTSDIFIRDLTSNPAYNNTGSFFYDNAEELIAEADSSGSTEKKKVPPSFLNYVEGIYIGYRFYETASEEGVIDYNKEIQYPFGYGLSYTSFSQKMGEITEKDGMISFDVTVTNEGNKAGKDVIEVYINPPYTNGGIEKASANLIAFDKTTQLEPGASEVLTISFNKEDMASYDAEENRCYILEAGDYGISIRSDSHNVIEEKTYTLGADIVYDENNTRSTDKVTAVNRFDDAKGDATYLSRADKFANYDEATAAPASLSISDEAKAAFTNSAIYFTADHNDPNDVMPVTGAKNGLELADLRGADFDDPKWDSLLDQLSIDEMDLLIAQAGYQTIAINSINKIQTIDCDGPASINNNFTGVGSIGFPSAVMIACTWDSDIAAQFGESIGKMAGELGVSGWYAPAMNGHRSAFAGRNFEYYSEDPLLSGKMAANAVEGARKHGVYSYIKHFALNDQETNRHNMLNTWADEQTIREIYLKPFEMAVKEGGAQAVMSGYNYIGATWCGGNDTLLNQVLREEWGFRGFVLTDYFGSRSYYMNADQAIRNGNDAMLVAYDTATNHVRDKESATSVKAMRQSSKNILYTVVNSRAYDEAVQVKMPGWQIGAIVIDVVLAAGIVALQVIAIKKYKSRVKETEANDKSQSLK